MDTDAVVLAVWVAQELHEVVDELWLAFGTGKNFCYIAAHELVACLGPEKSKSLLVFHAITGCDTVSAFVGGGKKTAQVVWNTFSGVTDAFLQLESGTWRFLHMLCLPLKDLLYCYTTAQAHVPCGGSRGAMGGQLTYPFD